LSDLVTANGTVKAVSNDRPIHFVHPLNDPNAWFNNPMFQPPVDVNVVQVQKQIDSMMGTTRNNESIYKLVWNGDRQYWHQLFMQWDVLGRPIGEPFRRPLIRHKVVRDEMRRPIGDVFPPRWLILTRLEPEQYAANWSKESFIWAPEIQGYKQIRPNEVPPVFWMWYATIAKHDEFCCGIAERDQRKCFGEYVPPQYIFDILGAQKLADDAAGTRPVFDSAIRREIDEGNNGYLSELESLEIERQIFLENPHALIGAAAGEKAGVTDAQARQIVKDFYDREAQELSIKS
jgi:hypothetical protein